MKINIVVVGILDENCYIIQKDNSCLIVDPGDEADKIISAVGNLQVEGILITHHHIDHIGALEDIKKHYNIEKINELNPKFNFEIIPTPGHKEDCLTFYFKNEKIMFDGDFIFTHTIGRTDLPGGSWEEMIKSLKLISTYPDDITLFPGHGPTTNLGQEKKRFNSYIC